MKKQVILFLFLTIGFQSIQAQEKTSIQQNFPIHISILDESTTIPGFGFLEYSYQPAFMVGTEYLLKVKEKSDVHITANLGYYHHKDWQSAIMILPEIGYRYKVKRWSFYSRFGAGYKHIFAAKTTYKFKDGEFRAVKDYGSPAFMTSLSLNASFKLNQEVAAPEIYATYMGSVELPFTIYAGIHQFMGVGFKFYPF